MTITASDVTTRFPEFAGADSGLLDACLEEAGREIAAVAWGDRADDGHKHLTAHLLAISLRNATATDGQASVRGPQMSQAVGPLRRDFASLGFSSKLTRNDMELMQTPYGARYAALRDLVFAPRMVI